MTSIAVVVVNWNGLQDTLACVESVLVQDLEDRSVIVVDNGSRGNDADIMADRFGSDITLVRNATNLGFSGGANSGIRIALAERPSYVYTLNNDTRMEPDALNEALCVAEGPGRPAMVGSKLLLMDRPGVINSTGFMVLRDGAAIDRGRFQRDEGQYDDSPEVFGPCAGAALYRASLLETVGMFDEDFFAYAEDVDMAWRARRAGHAAVFAPASRVHHRYSASTGAFSRFKVYQGERNRRWVLWKNYPWPLVAASPAVNVAKLMRLALAARRGTGRARSYRDSLGAGTIVRAIAKARIDSWKAFPRMMNRRRAILRATQVDDAEIARWLRELSVPMAEAPLL